MKFHIATEYRIRERNVLPFIPRELYPPPLSPAYLIVPVPFLFLLAVQEGVCVGGGRWVANKDIFYSTSMNWNVCCSTTRSRNDISPPRFVFQCFHMSCFSTTNTKVWRNKGLCFLSGAVSVGWEWGAGAGETNKRWYMKISHKICIITFPGEWGECLLYVQVSLNNCTREMVAASLSPNDT